MWWIYWILAAAYTYYWAHHSQFVDEDKRPNASFESFLLWLVISLIVGWIIAPIVFIFGGLHRLWAKVYKKSLDSDEDESK